MKPLIAVFVGMSLLFSGLASANDTGAISGRVTDEAGRPIERICVSAHSPAPILGGSAPVVETDGEGRYLISDLAPSIYSVHFHECYGSLWGGPWDRARDDLHSFAEQWWPRARRAELGAYVPVGLGTTGGIDAALPLAPGIAGRVVDEDGNGIPGIFVSWHPTDDPYQTGCCARTLSDGRYKLIMHPSVELRDLNVWFRSDIESPTGRYRAEWFDDVLDRSSARTLTYWPGKVTEGIDAALSSTA